MVRRGGIVQRIFGEKVPESVTVKRGITRTRRESNKGSTDTSTRWTDKRPHPANMDRYEDLNKDSAVSTAITMKTGMVAGVGFHLQMPQSVKLPENPPEDYEHPQIIALNEYLKKIKMDELAALIVRTTQEKGFCPVEKLDDGTFKILPPETVFIWTEKTGEVYKYTQEIGSRKIAEWGEKGEDFDDLLVFHRMWSPSRPYGKALVEDVADRVDSRRQIAEDVPDVIHKQGYPFRVVEAETQEIGDIAYTNFTEKEPDEDVFVYPVLENQLRIHTETLTPRIDFTEYVKHNDEMIAEGLIAPLPVWMKNATEASANVIMETIERDVEADQRYFARRFEADIYEPYIGEPTPHHVWGPSETGMEDITLEGIALLYNGGRGAITFGQAQNMIHELGLPIGELEDEAPTPAFDLPPNPMNPLQDQELYVLQANYTAAKITLSEALTEGIQIIDNYLTMHRMKTMRELEISLGKRPEPVSEATEEHFKLMRNELIAKYKKTLLDAGVKR
jgi:hypothetical protein